MAVVVTGVTGAARGAEAVGAGLAEAGWDRVEGAEPLPRVGEVAQAASDRTANAISPGPRTFPKPIVMTAEAAPRYAIAAPG